MIFSSDSQRKAMFAKKFLGNSNKFSAGDRMRPTKDLIAEQKALLFKINNMPREYTKEDVSGLVKRLDQLDYVLNQSKDKMSAGSQGFGDGLSNAIVGLWPEPKGETVSEFLTEVEPIKESVGDSVSDLVVGMCPEPVVAERREIVISPTGEAVEVVVKPKQSFGNSFADTFLRLWP